MLCRFRDARVSRARGPGCYWMAFSTAYVRRRWVVEMRLGRVCCAWVLLDRENTVKSRAGQGRAEQGRAGGGVHR